MSLKPAVIMSIISIIMLVIYGVDVMSAGNEKTGFLHMNPSIRGSILGGAPAAMLIISFFITRNEPSKKLGILITIGGALIIAGTGVILAIQGNAMTARGMREFGAVLVVGIIIVILGGIKIKKSR
jgi:drug/metabolite transporter (DMT)-like permease